VIFDETRFPFLTEHFQTAATTAILATVTESPVVIQQLPVMARSSGLGAAATAASASSASVPPSPPAHGHTSDSSAPVAPSPGPALCGSSPSGAPTVAPSAAPHPMLARSRAGVFKPNLRYALVSAPSLVTTGISPLPSLARVALRDPNWHATMAVEFEALQKNKTWRLVDRPPGSHIMTGNGCLSTNSTLMALWSATRPDGLFVGLLSARVWISVKHSPRCREARHHSNRAHHRHIA
jgi:hypothetical protein